METSLSRRFVEARVVFNRRNLVLCGLVGLLLAEILVLTLRFDSQSLVESGLWWGPLVGYARVLPQALMAVAAAALVFGGRGFSARPEPHRGRAWAWVYLLGHLAAFAALAWLTGAVWEGPLGRSAWAPLWVAAWLTTGLATFAFWLAVVMPADAWGALARQSWRVILAALAVGAGSCYVGRLTGALLVPLHSATLWCVHSVLAWIFRDVVYDPARDVVGTIGFNVEVASACSGYEGIGLIWVFLAVYLWFFRRVLKFPQALWLLPVGTVVIWLANVVRIVALIAIGARVSPSVALGGFHSQAGWLAFNAVALGLVALSRRVRVFSIDTPSTVPAAQDKGNPTAAYLGPLLALVAAVMVTGALSEGMGFDAYYPVRVLAVGAALWLFRRGYEGLTWSWSWPAVGIGAIVFAVWMVLEPSGSSSSGLAEGLERLSRPAAALWLAARVFGSVVTVPIAEELAFRGYLTRRLIAADFKAVSPGRFTWFSFVGSSCLFGALHGRTLAGVAAGAVYALALYRKGNLSEAVLAHATTNALIAAYVLTTGEWSLWV